MVIQLRMTVIIQIQIKYNLNIIYILIANITV